MDQTAGLSGFDLAAAFLVLIAIAGWINARFLKIPVATAMVLAGLAGAGMIALARPLVPGAGLLGGAIGGFDFPRAVLGYMLAFLLFAGAMQVDIDALRSRLATIASLATIGVVASTLIVGTGLWALARLVGAPIGLAWAMVFGALISPTDPIAVLAAVKQGRLSRSMQVTLQGEALFNDGVGIVIFFAALAVASSGQGAGIASAVIEVFVESAGGLALGVFAAWAAIRAMRAIDDHAVEVAFTLALAAGVYSLADLLHVSGPIGVVGAGMMIGSARGRAAMSENSRQHIHTFWMLVDEILNALLFLLLGLQVLTVTFAPRLAFLWIGALVLVLSARWLVVLPWGLFLGARGEVGATRLLTWGGLHGALSLALALQIPDGPARSLILSTTFAVVIFSVLVQGLTFGPLSARVMRDGR